MTLFRVRVVLDGFSGGPGVNTFYGNDLAPLRSALTNLYGGIWAQGVVPSSMTARIATEGDIIEETNGDIVGSWTAPAIAPAASSSSPGSKYAGPAGMALTWRTATVADGGRVSGRTFIVPMVSDAYESNGTLDEAKRLLVEGICATFVAAATPEFVIWHRPRLARLATPTLPALTAHPGSKAIVTGSSVRDKVAVLRSRRD